MVQQEDGQENSDFSANDVAVLGRRLLQANNPAAALPLLQRALEEQKAQGDTLVTGDTMISLGICYAMLGRRMDAEAQYNDALRLARDKLGSTHPLAGRALQQLGISKYLLGEVVEAVINVRQAISIYHEHWREPTPLESAAVALRRFGEWYKERGQLVEAEAAFRESLDALTLHGLSQTEREQTSDRLFKLYSEQGRLHDAAQLMSETLVADARRFWQDLVKVSQMAREKFLRQHRADVDRLLSNLMIYWPDGPHAAQVALDVLLWRRGLGLELYRCANRAGQRSPALQTKLDALRSMRGAFAKTIF